MSRAVARPDAESGVLPGFAMLRVLRG